MLLHFFLKLFKMQTREKRVVEEEIQRSEIEAHLWKEILLCALTPKLGVCHQANMKEGWREEAVVAALCSSKERGECVVNVVRWATL